MENKKSRASQSGARFYDILDKIILVILVGIVFLFILYPLLCIIKQSVLGEEGFSLAAYESILGKNMSLLKNSVFVAILSALLSTVLSIAVAFSVRFTYGNLTDQYGISTVYRITGLYSVIRKKRSDFQRTFRAFLKSLRMGRCCDHAESVFYIT